ncbi:MAG: hypothetical protein JW861_05500 [Bacteroidales bacterium]|nr:hypothetical protein [Bacteroidales bacterium]
MTQKLFRKASFVIITAALFCSSIQGQTVSLQNITTVPGSEVLMPLNFTGMNNVGAVSLWIIYDPVVLEFVDIANLISEAQGTLANSLTYGGYTVVGLSWLAPGQQGVDFPDGKFLDIRFNFTNGSSDLIFHADCEIVDWELNPITPDYTNGKVAPLTGATMSVWTGTGEWSDPVHWSNGVPGVNTQAVIADGAVDIQSGANCNDLIVQPNVTARVYPGFFLSVFDTLEIHGTFEILSDATGTGSFIHSGVQLLNGTVNLQRFLSGDGSLAHLVSSPVDNATAGVFSGCTVERFSETNQQWILSGTGDPMNPGSGFRIFSPTDNTYSFSGLINSGDLPVSGLTYTAGGGAFPPGFNLVGNPFPSAINWNLGDWIRNNINGSIYCWDGIRFVSWNGEIGCLYDGIVPAMQGFFVQASSGNPQLTIPDNSRIHDNQPYYKAEKEVENLLVLTFGDGIGTPDKSFVQFKSISAAGFDNQFDAHKLPGDGNEPEIYTFTSGQEPLSINVFPAPALQDTSIPLGYNVNQAGDYTITREQFTIYGRPIYLKDFETGDTINLKSDSVYTFYSYPGNFDSRFRICFFVPIASAGEQIIPEGNVYYYDRMLHVILPETTSNLEVSVIDLNGRTLYRNRFQGSNHLDIPLEGYSGLAIVRLAGESAAMSRKVLIYGK